MSNSVPKTLERDFEYKNHKFRINVILNYEKGLISKENKHQLKLSYLGSRNFQKTILCESYSLSMEITRLQSEAKNWVDSESGVSEEETILEMLGFKRV